MYMKMHIFELVFILYFLKPSTVTCPEFFAADSYRYQTYKGATMVHAEQRSSQNLCLQILEKCTPWLCVALWLHQIQNTFKPALRKLFFRV